MGRVEIEREEKKWESDMYSCSESKGLVGYVSRESIDSTLKAYNDCCAEMRSRSRDACIQFRMQVLFRQTQTEATECSLLFVI